MRSSKRMTGTFAGIGALAVALLLAGAGSAGAQVASPLQSGHNVPGVINIRDMATPPPGLFVIWYNWFPSSNTYIDRNGNKLETLNLSQIDPSLPDVDIDLDTKAFASVPALAWGSTFTLLGGARYIVGVSPNWAVANFTFVAEPGGPGFDPSDSEVIDGSVSGFSDIFVTPFGLSWHLGHFDLTTNYGFYAPTGRYETGADDNVGLGFWTHQFQGFGYFYPLESQATAIMAGLTYELNSEIKDIAVKPGNRLSLDWGVSQYLTEWLELGVQGAHNWQVTDDTGSDVFWDPSWHDRKSSLGFSAGFWPWRGRLNVIAKYAFDFGARQRFDTTYFTLNFIWLTNALDGM